MEAAHKYGAKSVGFDLLFTEDSEWGEDDDTAFRNSIPEDGTVVLPSLIQASLTPELASTQKGKSHPLLDVSDDGVVRRVAFELRKKLDDGETSRWTALGLEVAHRVHLAGRAAIGAQ